MTFDAELVLLAEPGDEHPRRRDLAQRVDKRDLAGLALDLALGDELADSAAQRLVDGAGRAAGLLHAVEQVDDDRLRGMLGDVAGFDLDVHGESP